MINLNSSIVLAAKSKLPTEYGEFDIYVFHNRYDDKEHLAIVKGEVENADNVLIRVHSECLTGDVFGSKRCDCGPQLQYALRKIEKMGRGMVLYMRQEGRGIGLTNKIKSYELQEKGFDTVEANIELGFPADMREYTVCAQILQYFKIKSIRLLTNNISKINELKKLGIEVTERVPIIIKANKFNEKYLQTKVNKMGHMLK